MRKYRERKCVENCIDIITADRTRPIRVIAEMINENSPIQYLDIHAKLGTTTRILKELLLEPMLQHHVATSIGVTNAEMES